jgi:hypothetical protein
MPEYYNRLISIFFVRASHSGIGIATPYYRQIVQRNRKAHSVSCPLMLILLFVHYKQKIQES